MDFKAKMRKENTVVVSYTDEIERAETSRARLFEFNNCREVFIPKSQIIGHEGYGRIRVSKWFARQKGLESYIVGGKQ